jgi:hypothetical protein
MARWMEAMMPCMLISSISAALPIVRRQFPFSVSQKEEAEPSKLSEVDSYNFHAADSKFWKGRWSYDLEPTQFVEPRHGSDPCEDKSTHKGTLAVIVVGVQDRLVLSSKLSNLIAPTAKLGYKVDFYISVVHHGIDPGIYSPIKHSTDSPEGEAMFYSLKEAVASAGGCLRVAEVTDIVNVSIPPNTPSKKRLFQYDPLVNVAGLNVLRKFSAVEKVMSKLKQFERPDFVVLTRDDDHWLLPFDLDFFSAQSGTAVYTKNCAVFWGGVNEKTFVFSWDAADKLLSRLYSDFWIDDPQLVTGNIETYWQQWIKKNSFAHQAVALKIPTATVGYQDAALCIKPFYACNLNATESQVGLHHAAVPLCAMAR